MTDMIPKEQYDKIEDYKAYLLESTNLTEDQAYTFAWYLYTLRDGISMMYNNDLQIETEYSRSVPKPVVFNGHVYFCPNCNRSVWQIQTESNFCFRCGQALDWSKVRRPE